MRKYLFLLVFFVSLKSVAQKKVLDHTVYDNWKSIGERMISNDGAFVVYTVNPQEGDGELVIQNPKTKYKKVVSRGYSATITEDSKYLIFKIKPFFQDTRQAKIKKKKGDDMPKDSFAIVELGKDSVIKITRVKNYKTPEKGFGFVAYQMEKPLPDTSKKKAGVDSVKIKNKDLVKLADSLLKVAIDSIKGNITKEELSKIVNKAALQIIKEGKDMADADGDDAAGGKESDGTDLVLRNLGDNKETIFKLVSEYYFDKKGTKLLIETTKNSKDSNSKAVVLLYNLLTMKTDTVMKGFNDAKNYVLDEEGNQLAFVSERDSSEKALTKFYKLWYYTNGQDSAKIIADKNVVGIQLGYSVSENAGNSFSKDGSKLYFGTAPIRSPKDTTLVDFEIAKVDIWHYKDDYLQTQQLKNIDAELKRSYTAVYHIGQNKVMQLGTEDAERITLVDEGNANWVLGESDKGHRVEMQWDGRTKQSAYIINTETGERKTVFKDLYANANASPAGKFVYWYSPEKKNYFTYEVASGITRNVTNKIKVPLYEEDNDVPDFAAPYGVMGWTGNDSLFLMYDKYVPWRINPLNTLMPYRMVTTNFIQELQDETTYRYIKTDKEERFIDIEKALLFKAFDNSLKYSDYTIEKRMFSSFISSKNKKPKSSVKNTADIFIPMSYNGVIKSKDSTIFIFTKESFNSSPALYYCNKYVVAKDSFFSNADFRESTTQLSDINPQQKEYNWLTAELFKWEAYNGKQATGILYKPENFDPKKKYPLICYFYEKYSDNLYNYQGPAPTPSRLNIPFFVSRGYIVLAPDIEYKVGYPGKSAYDYVASGARALVKAGLVDSTKMGIQGQSWGGYQVAYLITKTKMFKAAWAGAPVANMTSAYGGIRWESGLNRQFQYEKQQSRIGATLWEKPQLYIENSPLFHLPKVQTPLVIMHNDADGAVPWYQGIELFTGLRRLGKPVWMLNYNNDAHNLMERKNRKDIQIREQQFFDWQLKGEKPPKWITEGVPATEKGKDWGLQID
ncbi:MAG: prolyl oligopeptidase family serine peptidase [Bacteroidota bacterium]